MAKFIHLGNAPLLIIDGHNLAHAGSYDKSRQGRLRGAAEAILSYLRKVVSGFQPVKVVMTWDTGIAPWRRLLCPGYKAHRKKHKNPDDAAKDKARREAMQADIKILQNSILPLLGVDQLLGSTPTEADDIIYSVVQDYRKNRRFSSAVIVSNDKDLIQLMTPVSSADTPKGRTFNVYRIPTTDISINREDFRKGVRISHRLQDGCDVLSTYGHWPDDHVLFASIVGDSSDNIRGVPGLGAKFAGGIVEDFGSIKKCLRMYAESKVACYKKSKQSAKLKKLFLPENLKILQNNIGIMTLKEPEAPPVKLPGRALEGMAGIQLHDTVGAIMKQQQVDPFGTLEPAKWLAPFTEYCSLRATRYRLLQAVKGKKA